MENLFEMASRKKFRFNTAKGAQSVEELWDMPLTAKTAFSLDAVAIHLDKQIKDSGEKSFVVKKTVENTELGAKMSIVKHIIEVRLAEIDAKKNELIKQEKKAQIERLIYDKENEALRETSLEDLKKMRDSI